MSDFIKAFDLQLFAEESAEGATAESGVATANDSNGESVNPVDLEAKFDEMIKGEYKDVYGKRVQNTIEKRLKSSKEVEQKYNALSPVLRTLADKYAIEDINDVNSILKAMEEDDSYYENEALEKGMSVKDLKAVKKMERENAELHKQLEAQKRQEETDRIINQWITQSDALKQFYPNFDLDAEMGSNEQFVSLLKAGIDVRTAFEVTHRDEIVPSMMQYTAKAVEQKVVNSIANNGARPIENLGGNQAASTSKRGVASLTKAEREELARRAARGEKITLTDL